MLPRVFSPSLRLSVLPDRRSLTKAYRSVRKRERLCEATSLVTLSEEDKYYYKEVPDFRIEYNVSAPGDFYELLGVDQEADVTSIKAAFREKQRLVHPDIAGDDGESQASVDAAIGETAVDVSVLLNKAYQILMDANLRAPYDAELHAFRQLHGFFDGKPVSQWLGSDQEQRAVFVDETTCIGCRNCSGCAPNTFFIEETWGRARVSHQWGDEEEWVREAMDMCPVDCIYFVQKKQLALLEFVMKACHREDTVILARRRSGNMGTAPSKENPFSKAADFMKNRAYAKMAQFSHESQIAWIQDEVLAAAIAKAWLQLPEELRLKGWPAWFQETNSVY